MKTTYAKRATVVGALLLACSTALAQDETRQIWDSGFRQKRPAPPSDDRTRPVSTPTVEYRTSDPPPRPSAGTVLVGFTMWRLRPAGSAETAPRLLVQDPGVTQPAAYIPERLRPAARLRIGDRVRLGVEVAQGGYLYIIDRERFADGSRGTPYLIFPARRLRDGDNRISPGRLVEIPDQRDTVPALRLRRRDDRYVGEELLVVVTDRPIENLPVADTEVPLPATQVAEWERRWGAPAQRLDQVSANDAAAWTAAEQAAGLAQRLLTQEDPLPASLFRIPSSNDGIAVSIPLSVE